MEALLNQVNFDCLSIEYLSAINAKATPSNLQVIRNYFNNNQDDLLDALLNVDECRKAKGNAVIEQFTKVKRFNNKRRKSA